MLFSCQTVKRLQVVREGVNVLLGWGVKVCGSIVGRLEKG